MTALLIVSIIALIVSLAAVVVSAVISFYTVSSTNRLVSSMHQRSGAQLDKTLDRLMTINWEQFSAMRDGTTAEWGYQSLPGYQSPHEQVGEDEDQPDQLAPDLWGRMRGIIDDALPDEKELIEEDFARDEEEKVES